jgi:hypothetical protein
MVIGSETVAVVEAKTVEVEVLLGSRPWVWLAGPKPTCHRVLTQ